MWYFRSGRASLIPWIAALVTVLGVAPRGNAAEAGAAAAPAAVASVAVKGVRPQSADEVIPPPVPEAGNAAALYLEAMAVLEAEDVWNSNLAALAAEVYTSVFSPSGRRSFVAWVDALRIPQEGNRQPNVGEVYDEFTRRLESPAVIKAMTLIAQATERPQCRFNIDYSKGAETLLPHLAKLRNLSRFLGAVGGAAVERGDRESAWECALWELRLADSVRTEPLLISQLVRIAMASIACSTVQQAAVPLPPAAAIVPTLDQRLAGFDDPGPAVLAIDGERLIFTEWIFRQPQAKIQELLQAGAEAAAPAPTAEQVAAARVVCSQATARLAELAAQPYYQVRGELEAFPGTIGRGNPLAQSLLPSLGNYCRRVAESQALVRVTRLGLRVTQHKAAQGAYPPSLAALKLADIPAEKQQDPFTGKPLCYRPAGDGFVLYSVGPDGVDDGGTPRAGDAKVGYDLVWRSER